MNKEIKVKWIEALRSGVYKQTKSALKNAEGYCCLGVLCEVMGVATEAQKMCKYSGVAILLSHETLVVAGLSEEDQKDLADLNDYEFSFSKIADHIEKNL